MDNTPTADNVLRPHIWLLDSSLCDVSPTPERLEAKVLMPCDGSPGFEIHPQPH